MWPKWCVDMDTSTSLGSAGSVTGRNLPSNQLFHSWHEACVWRNVTDGAVHVRVHTEMEADDPPGLDAAVALRQLATVYYAADPNGVDTLTLPRCFFPSTQIVDSPLTTRNRTCRPAVHDGRFVQAHGRFMTVSI